MDTASCICSVLWLLLLPRTVCSAVVVDFVVVVVVFLELDLKRSSIWTFECSDLLLLRTSRLRLRMRGLLRFGAQ